MRWIIVPVSLGLLTACNFRSTDGEEQADAQTSTAEQNDNLADTMASMDPATGQRYQADIPDSEERPMMQLQVVLDRRGFGPGVIDGEMGLSTKNAIEGFQEANALEVTGELDEATKTALAEWSNIPATRVVTIPANWGEIDYAAIPDGAPEQAKMERLGYESLDEKLAERFHTTVEVLKMLNPDGRPAGAQGIAASSPAASTASPAPTASARPKPGSTPTASASGSDDSAPEEPVFTAGQQIRVPNIGGDRIEPGAIQEDGWRETLASLGVGSKQPKAARIVVSRSAGTLKAFDASDKLVALFTVTSGSQHDPLPLGEWGITGVAYNPPFAYDPELFWDVPDTEEKQQLPPGPNGPVGVAWIDLTKEHYGIHGTSAPETIGRAQSHGCVRLTNWDVARLSGMVDSSTKVLFEA